MPCLLILELLRMRRVRFWGVQDLRVLTIQFIIFHNFFSNGPVLFGSTTAFGCSNSHSKTDACLLQIPDHEALSLRIFSGQPAPFGGISDSRFLLNLSITTWAGALGERKIHNLCKLLCSRGLCQYSMFAQTLAQRDGCLLGSSRFMF